MVEKERLTSCIVLLPTWSQQPVLSLVEFKVYGWSAGLSQLWLKAAHPPKILNCEWNVPQEIYLSIYFLSFFFPLSPFIINMGLWFFSMWKVRKNWLHNHEEYQIQLPFCFSPVDFFLRGEAEVSKSVLNLVIFFLIRLYKNYFKFFGRVCVL